MPSVRAEAYTAKQLHWESSLFTSSYDEMWETGAGMCRAALGCAARTHGDEEARNKYKPDPNVEINLSIIQRQRARRCAPASPGVRHAPQLRNPLFLNPLILQSACLALGAAPGSARLCRGEFQHGWGCADLRSLCWVRLCCRPTSQLLICRERGEQSPFWTVWSVGPGGSERRCCGGAGAACRARSLGRGSGTMLLHHAV